MMHWHLIVDRHCHSSEHKTTSEHEIRKQQLLREHLSSPFRAGDTVSKSYRLNQRALNSTLAP
jgi:hypothetical protein